MTVLSARRGSAAALFLIAIAVLLTSLVGSAAARPTAPAGADSAAFKFKTFHTPSGNIQCGIVKSGGRWSIRCDTYERDWSPPPKDCVDGDNGGSIGMGGKSRPRFICVSDAIDPPGKTLKYGKKLSFGPFLCKSKVKGLKCWNKLGRGFFVSKQSYNFFY